MLTRFVIFLSGLSGAGGVATYAAAAHVAGADDPARFALSNAAIMMMVHAAGATAVALAAHHARGAIAWRLIALGLVSGALLFGGAVALPKLVSPAFALFPMAAPIGGSLTIVSWLALSLCGLVLWGERAR